MPTLKINDTTINFTVRGSYKVEINPENGARQWRMEIFAGPNAVKPAQYHELIPLLLSSSLAFTDEEGIARQVEISDMIHVTGVLQGFPILSVAIAEPHFDATSDDDIEITGTLMFMSGIEVININFTTTLANFNTTDGFIGQFGRSLTGHLVQTGGVASYGIWSFTIPNWRNPMPRVGSWIWFSVEYTDKTGIPVQVFGSGRPTTPPRLAGDTLSITLEEAL